jgi:hypothetical protein
VFFLKLRAPALRTAPTGVGCFVSLLLKLKLKGWGFLLGPQRQPRPRRERMPRRGFSIRFRFRSASCERAEVRSGDKYGKNYLRSFDHLVGGD